MAMRNFSFLLAHKCIRDVIDAVSSQIHGDYVEAKNRIVQRIVENILFCRQYHFFLLSSVHPFGWVAEACARCGLDLHERNRTADFRDNIYLSPFASPVARNNAIAALLQKFTRDILAANALLLRALRHRILF